MPRHDLTFVLVWWQSTTSHSCQAGLLLGLLFHTHISNTFLLCCTVDQSFGDTLIASTVLLKIQHNAQ